MDVQVRSYRGIERAAVTVAPIAILAGRNGSGKTSLLEGAAAALSGEPLPIFDGERSAIKKKDAGEVVANGAKRGKAVVEGPDGASWINWPGAKAQSQGAPPHASALATGLIDWPALPEKRRAAILGNLLTAEPTYEDLVGAYADEIIELDDEDRDFLAQVWAEIQEQGWDPIHSSYKDALSRIKGRWEEATGQRYGAEKADGWQPDGWGRHLEDLTAEYLEESLADAREKVSRIEQHQAVSADRRSTLQAEADELEAAQAEKAKADENLAGAQDQLTSMQGEYRQMATGPSAHCPSCEAGLSIFSQPSGFKVDLSTAEPADEETLSAKTEGIEAQKQRVATMREQRDEAAAKVQRAGNAQAELEGLPEPGGEAGDLEEAKAELDTARLQAQAKQLMDRARQHYTEAVQYAALVTALSPDGVRRQALVRTVQAFNDDYLVPLSDAWAEPVRLDADFLPYYGARPFHLLSLSEAYRVRVTMRVALAALDGSQAVILDGVDVLDSPGRKHFLNLLQTAVKNPALPGHYLVGITLNRQDQVPGLEKAGLGAAYWIEGGQAHHIAPNQGAA